MEAIIAENISKDFRLFTNKRNKLFELLFRKDQMSVMRALSNITFSVDQGESLGLVGLNGSGKSTLANIIAGIAQPTAGKMTVNGTASCISVSVGLNHNLTGMENIEYKGMLLGFNNEEINELKPKIISFADIGNYINQPVKYYSSGMSARLGFAISININPDILVIDEGLSVGDQTFTEKCMKAMNEYRAQGKTIVFVSHSLASVQSFCSKVMWLEYGNLRLFGEVKDVCAQYRNFIALFNKMTVQEKNEYKNNIVG